MTASSAWFPRWPYSCYGLGFVHGSPRRAVGSKALSLSDIATLLQLRVTSTSNVAALMASSACSSRWPYSCYGLGSAHGSPRRAFSGTATLLQLR
eukprot:6322670-Prorocentrum_lima.AAC.1